ncbi:MAG TPA: diacylglycerol kinase family protein [Bacteroidales bacterium]|nr:diacylglycerol kinase family protein [Bacteroidales bacterium]
MKRYLVARLKSFRPAFEGLWIMLKEEPNARIHLLALITVVVLGILLNISKAEWITVALASGLVIGIEAINSAIENLSDFVSPQYHIRIKKVKDLSAAAVLVSALAALATGLIIYIPKLLDLC